MVHDLGNAKWMLAGWRPYQWLAHRSPEAATFGLTDEPPVPARVPGSVQQALLDAGVLDDWHHGINSRYCEWVEHRHWQFRAVLPEALFPKGQPAILDAPGLDYSGWIYFGGVEVGRFEGALLPHRFDLTPYLKGLEDYTLDIIFEEPPREHGYCGFTSKSRFFKPRYSYGWDWCPRFVPIGIWDSLSLRTGVDACFDLTDVRAELFEDNVRGRVSGEVAFDPGMDICGAASVRIELSDGTRVVASTTMPAVTGRHAFELEQVPVQPWWPNGLGEAKCYGLAAVALDAEGRELGRATRTAGFKRVRWLPCDGAPEGAEPWVCEVNGQPVFLQGVNWTPARMAYQDVTGAEYRRLVALYRDMGCNCLRVWGGGILETAAFYDACDRAGQLVWQEFPLSSSTIDNWPPEDETAIVTLASIARTYIERRGHHPSLLLWSGGNELQGGPDGAKVGWGRPVGYGHPCIDTLAEVVRRHDPGRRFIPTSASGPRQVGLQEEFGQGLHHDTHGPWGLLPGQTEEDWHRYWSRDDALFRSEVGAPGASSIVTIQDCSGGLPVWPPEGPYWNHTSIWWSQWNRYREATGELSAETALAHYVELSQRDQAEALAVAARATRSRFPACGGFIVWMGHDCFPCISNNSLLEFGYRPKPAYVALQQVFRDSYLSDHSY